MTLPKATALLVAILGLYSPLAHGQTAPGTGPIGPIRQLPVPAARDLGLTPSPMDSSNSQAQADTHTLSSIEMLGVGSLGAVRSFLDPSFRFTQSLDTGIVPGTNNSVSSLGANFKFDHQGARSEFTGAYSGAQTFYRPSSVYDGAFHNLSASEEFRWARWILRMHDDLVVSPDTSFGGLDFGGANSQIAQQSSAVANDTILTQRAKRLNNTASAEIDYFLSRRSILTFAGSYMNLHFTQPGLLNSSGASGRVGYDYALSPKNFIGLSYNYMHISFSGGVPALQTDAAQLAYGRKITGRLALQVAAGPQVLRAASWHDNAWTLSSSAIFQTLRTQYSLSYSHAVSAGSGVFLGAQTHVAAGSVRYALSRLWVASGGGGYAFNKSLIPVAGVNDSFGNWYGNAGISRAIGRHLQFNVDYRYQQQATGIGACPIAACGPTQSRQVLSAGIEWHPWSAAR